MTHARSDLGSYAVSGQKRFKSAGKSSDTETPVCSVSACHDHSGGNLLDRCSEQHRMASSSGAQMQNTGLFAAMQGNVFSTDNTGGVYLPSGLGYPAGQHDTQSTCLRHQPFEGCMYVNDMGEFCGPYPPEQLYEGLSMGFLFPGLAIYAVFGGKMAYPMPLGSLKQFLSQWSVGAAVSTPSESMKTKKITSTDKMVLPDALSSEEACWMFENAEGCQQGPHSIAELSYWHHNSYLQDLTMIYHVDGKFGPFTLVSLIGRWSGGHAECSGATANDSASLNGLLGNLFHDVSHQLHAGIMKSARRVLIDEIFSCVLPDVIASKKTKKELAAKMTNQAAKPDSVSNKKVSALMANVDTPSTVQKKQSTSYNVATANSSMVLKSTAADKLADVLSAVWQTVYYESMESMWDGVLSDPVMDYCNVWLQRKCQLNLPCTIISDPANVNTQGNDEMSPKDTDASECGTDFPPGFGPSGEPAECSHSSSLLEVNSGTNKNDEKHESNTDLCSGPSAGAQIMLANELYVASKHSVFRHFEEIIAEEIANCLCSGLASSIDQENIGAPLHAVDSPTGAPLQTTDSPIPARVSTHGMLSPIEMVQDEELNAVEMAPVSSPAKTSTNEKLRAAEMITDETHNSHAEDLSLSSVSFGSIFEKMDQWKTAELDESFDEVPPGMETNLLPLVPVDKSRYQPSKLMCPTPVISRYITLALCRQRLHENVVTEWASLLSNTISKCLDSWYTRQNAVPKVAAGSLKLNEYTYYRRRKVNKTCQATSSKKPVEISMDEQPSKPLCELVENKNYEKNVQESRKAVISKRGSVDKPTKRGAKTVANDSYDLNIQQDLKLLSSAVPQRNRSSHLTKEQVGTNKAPRVNDSVLTRPVKNRKRKNTSCESNQTVKPTIPCPESDGCARASISGWEWRSWAQNATPSERARVRGYRVRSILSTSNNNNMLKKSQGKGPSARTNRVKLRNLIAATEGSELLKIAQMKARKKRLRFQRSKIHEWGLVALELIDAEEFVIEYVGELISRQVSDIRERQYEKSGIGSSYLFRLDDDFVVGDTDYSSLNIL
ncbi:hypothetical protein ACP70R_033302 [Stipagrostis hirtigluma subsp. patula]